MKLKSFRGGIHPFDGKALSMDSSITALKPKDELVFPVLQHIGAFANPIVAAGEHVLAGQIIAKAGSLISSDIISSVSGTVKAVEPRLTSSGDKIMSVVISNDGNYTLAEGIGKQRDYSKLSKDEIRNIIKESGIVGLGGAGFPTSVKLTPKDDNSIDYLIINGAECEPYITSDYRMMLERPEKLIGGIRIALSLFPNTKCVIGIEDNKPKAIELLSELCLSEEKIEVCPLKAKYPQGGERCLIRAIANRDIDSKKLPFDVGCIVINVASCVAVYDAVCLSTPLMKRIVTVTGDCVSKPSNFEAFIGTSVSELIDAAGGFSATPEKIIAGGPMMGSALFSTDVPVIKTTSSILALSSKEAARIEGTECIRCGRCSEVCPERLAPARIAKLAEKKRFDMFEEYRGMECIECGCCSYICPAKRLLTENIRFGKRSVLAKRAKA